MSRRGVDLPGVTDVRGDATDPAVLARAFADGADAVVLAIGAAKGTDHNRAAVTKAVLDALPESVERVVVHSSPPHYEYRLTERGHQLAPLLDAMRQAAAIWGR